MSLADEKINALIKKCEKYKNHLITSLEKEFLKTMPDDVIKDYQIEGNLDFDKLITTANTGRSIYWSSNTNRTTYQFQSHSSESHPKLHSIIKKINLVNKMLDCLISKDEFEQKSSYLAGLLTEENQSLLKSNDRKKFFQPNEGKIIIESIINLGSVDIFTCRLRAAACPRQ